MKFSFLFVLMLVFTSCGGKGPTKFYSASEASFSKFVNEKDMPKNPNLTLDKSIVNNEYPIQLALYKNKKFYYDLPNLDDGTGTWSYVNGQIILKSKHRLFDMRIDVKALDENAGKLAITFIDRFGPHTLKMDNSNLE
jgi:predicted small lipoprotein YifL